MPCKSPVNRLLFRTKTIEIPDSFVDSMNYGKNQQDSSRLESELEDLKEELESFQKEKEKVRAVIGQIGGVPRFRTKLMNAIFIAILAVSVVLSVILGEKWRTLMIELATVTLSLKIIYLIHCQVKINHFKFWILSSIEWRLNEVKKQITQLHKDVLKQ